VAPQNRRIARSFLLEIASELDASRTVVRVNPVPTSDFALDLAAIVETRLTTCMLAKAESSIQLAAAAPLEVIALCETPLEIVHAASIAAADSCAGMMWGSEDLALELGLARSRTIGRLSPILESARHTVLFAAKASGKVAIDAAFPDLDDDINLRSETIAAVEAGFDSKACVHPSQLGVVRAAFLPDGADVTWPTDVIAEGALRQDAGFRFRGSMVDADVIRRAHSVLSRAN